MNVSDKDFNEVLNGLKPLNSELRYPSLEYDSKGWQCVLFYVYDKVDVSFTYTNKVDTYIIDATDSQVRLLEDKLSNESTRLEDIERSNREYEPTNYKEDAFKRGD